MPLSLLVAGTLLAPVPIHLGGHRAASAGDRKRPMWPSHTSEVGS